MCYKLVLSCVSFILFYVDTQVVWVIVIQTVSLLVGLMVINAQSLPAEYIIIYPCSHCWLFFVGHCLEFTVLGKIIYGWYNVVYAMLCFLFHAQQINPNLRHDFGWYWDACKFSKYCLYCPLLGYLTHEAYIYIFSDVTIDVGPVKSTSYSFHCLIYSYVLCNALCCKFFHH